MATLLIPTPIWATPDGWFTTTAHTLEQADDEQLVDHFHRLACACILAADQGVHNVALVAARRWSEWVIGVRLGDGVTPDGKPINPGPAFAKLTPRQRLTCRQMGRLDGDILHDHLRRATSIDEVGRQACLRYVDAEVAS
jgi:hypothetical protein